MKKRKNSVKSGLLTIVKLHFALIALIAGQTILYDASQLITPDIVLKRWIAISLLLAVNGVIWYLLRSRAGHELFNKGLVVLIVLTDIFYASFSVYTQRGMASRAVFMFVIPIIVAGLLLSRSALFATAILSIAAYSLSAVSYFVLNFNEGYKVELYGEVGFYSLAMLIIAGMLAAVLKYRE